MSRRTTVSARLTLRSSIEPTWRGRVILLSAAVQAGVKKIVYTSSVATMGIPADGTPGDERTAVSLEAMIGHYKRSKFLAEQVVLEAAAAGTPAVVVNPSTPVGPGDVKPTPTGQLVLDAAAGRMPAYVDTGLNIVHVDDVAAGHLMAFHRGRIGERYILGGEDMTLQQILGYIAQLVGRKAAARAPSLCGRPADRLHCGRHLQGHGPAAAASRSKACACRANTCSSRALKRFASWGTGGGLRPRPSMMP